MAEISNDEFLRQAAEARGRIQEEPAEVALRSDPDSRTLVDVRGADEYANNHLSGAVNIPLDQFSERVASDLPDKNATVVCYCNGGNRGALAADALQKMGFSNVVSLAGGLNGAPEALTRRSG